MHRQWDCDREGCEYSTISRKVIIDSRWRDQAVFPSPSKYDMVLDDELFMVKSMRLVTADVPFSAYLVGAGAAGAVPLSLWNTVGSNTVVRWSGVAQLPQGDYATPEEFGTALQTALTSSTAATGYPTTFQVYHDARLDRFQIMGSMPFSLNFGSNLLSSSCSPPWSATARLMGFSPRSNYVSQYDASPQVTWAYPSTSPSATTATYSAWNATLSGYKSSATAFVASTNAAHSNLARGHSNLIALAASNVLSSGAPWSPSNSTWGSNVLGNNQALRAWSDNVENLGNPIVQFLIEGNNYVAQSNVVWTDGVSDVFVDESFYFLSNLQVLRDEIQNIDVSVGLWSDESVSHVAPSIAYLSNCARWTQHAVAWTSNQSALATSASNFAAATPSWLAAWNAWDPATSPFDAASIALGTSAASLSAHDATLIDASESWASTASGWSTVVSDTLTSVSTVPLTAADGLDAFASSNMPIVASLTDFIDIYASNLVAVVASSNMALLDATTADALSYVNGTALPFIGDLGSRGYQAADLLFAEAAMWYVGEGYETTIGALSPGIPQEWSTTIAGWWTSNAPASVLAVTNESRTFATSSLNWVNARLPVGYTNTVIAPFRRDFRGDRCIVLKMTPTAEVLSSTSTAIDRTFAVLPKGPLNELSIRSMEMHPDEKRWLPPLARIARVGVEMLDADGNLYDFQNQDHRLELIFDCVGHRVA